MIYLWQYLVQIWSDRSGQFSSDYPYGGLTDSVNKELFPPRSDLKNKCITAYPANDSIFTATMGLFFSHKTMKKKN